MAFYTHASMRELIEAEGFEVHPFERVGPAWKRVHGRDRGTGNRREEIRVLRDAREWIVGSIPQQVTDLQDIIASWRPDVIGAEASMWGPLLVLSELGPVPVALVSPLISAQVPASGGRPRAGWPPGCARSPPPGCGGAWTLSGRITDSVRWAAR